MGGIAGVHLDAEAGVREFRRAQDPNAYTGTSAALTMRVSPFGIIATDPTTTADAMFFLFQTDLRPDLGKITAPMVAIVADNDGQVPREALEATWHAQIDKVAHHDLVVIEHAKHFVMLDQPDAFQAALDKVLAQK